MKIARIIILIGLMLITPLAYSQTNFENNWSDTISLVGTTGSINKLCLVTKFRADLSVLQIQFNTNNQNQPVLCTLKCKDAKKVHLNHVMRKKLLRDILLTSNISKSDIDNYLYVKRSVKKHLMKVRRLKIEDNALFNNSNAMWEKSK